MKKLLVAFLLLPVILFSQEKKNHPYLNINVGIHKFKDVDVMPQGSLSVGAHIQDLGIGFGMGVTKFPGDERAYVPIFGEFCLIPKNKKVSPYGSIRIGSAIYRSTPTQGIETRAGLYSAINAGIASSIKGGSRVIFGVGYIRTAFNTDIKIRNSIQHTGTSVDGFTVFFGVVI